MNKEDYFKYYIQGSDHYLIPKDVFEELFDEMSNWRDESKQLKAKLEMYENGVYYSSENDKLKEVIEEVKRVLRCNNIEVLKYYDEPSETGSYEIVTVDLLQILDKAKERRNNV